MAAALYGSATFFYRRAQSRRTLPCNCALPVLSTGRTGEKPDGNPAACQRPVFHKRRAASGRWIRRAASSTFYGRSTARSKDGKHAAIPAYPVPGCRPACPLAAWLTRKPNARRCASSIALIASITLAACGRVAVIGSRAGLESAITDCPASFKRP